jgi:GAF domain-containing protein
VRGAAPSLPEEYSNAIHGVTIGPMVGSCGTAAFTARTVVVTDIAVDPRWASFRELPLKHSLRACWSTPILSGKGQVLGTFALYYREPRAPAPNELAAIESSARLATGDRARARAGPAA